MSLPDWARAHGAPLFAAAIRSSVADFDVTEELGYDFTGDGEHDFLWIRKSGANTEWVARQLAKFAAVQSRDVGFAGLKDRHAVTRQWFSVPRWHAPDWSRLAAEGVEVLDVQRHNRKLRRGAHRANRFAIVLRGAGIARHAETLDERLGAIRAQGVPNYFGEQRFGRGGHNLALADAFAAGQRLPRHKRSLAISTMRSCVFNERLSARVVNGTWNTLLRGDTANLDGTGSVFEVTDVDDELMQRCAALDVHPAGELIGDGSSCENASWIAALSRARVEPGSRSYRLGVRDIAAAVEDDAITLTFTLGRGAFATAILRELADVSDASGRVERSPGAPSPG